MQAIYTAVLFGVCTASIQLPSTLNGCLLHLSLSQDKSAPLAKFHPRCRPNCSARRSPSTDIRGATTTPACDCRLQRVAKGRRQAAQCCNVHTYNAVSTLLSFSFTAASMMSVGVKDVEGLVRTNHRETTDLWTRLIWKHNELCFEAIIIVFVFIPSSVWRALW